MPRRTDRPIVVVRDGLTVPLAALQLLWDLEARGVDVVVQGGRLIVSPRARITPTDDAAIREHRDVLVSLVAYAADVQ